MYYLLLITLTFSPLVLCGVFSRPLCGAGAVFRRVVSRGPSGTGRLLSNEAPVGPLKVNTALPPPPRPRGRSSQWPRHHQRGGRDRADDRPRCRSSREGHHALPQRLSWSSVDGMAQRELRVHPAPPTAPLSGIPGGG